MQFPPIPSQGRLVPENSSHSWLNDSTLDTRNSRDEPVQIRQKPIARDLTNTRVFYVKHRQSRQLKLTTLVIYFFHVIEYSSRI